MAKRLAIQPHSGYTKFGLKGGDKVSHKRGAYTLAQKTGYGSKTMTGTLTDKAGNTKRVRFDEVRPGRHPDRQSTSMEANELA